MPKRILSPQEQYDKDLTDTKMNLRRIYNEYVQVIAKQASGEIDMEAAMDLLNEIDNRWTKILVDRLAPKKNILEV